MKETIVFFFPQFTLLMLFFPNFPIANLDNEEDNLESKDLKTMD
jgi:hypothetical protein